MLSMMAPLGALQKHMLTTISNGTTLTKWRRDKSKATEVFPCREMACEKLSHLSRHKLRMHEACPPQICIDDGFLCWLQCWASCGSFLSEGLGLVPPPERSLHYRMTDPRNLHTSTWRTCCKFGRLICTFIPFDAYVSWGPPELHPPPCVT